MNGAAEVADAVVAAIHAGDTAGLRQLLDAHPAVVSAPLGGRYKSRTPLHIVTDWPGYFPNGPQIVRLLVEAGADPNVRQRGEETPLHWAASSDDWHVAAALIETGADINAPDGSIGTPLEYALGSGDRSLRYHPFVTLIGDAGDPVVVGVVVDHHKALPFGGRGDE